MVDDQRRGAAGHGIAREVVAVAREAAYAEEELTGPDGTVVVGEAGYVDRWGARKQNVQIHRRQRVAAAVVGRYGVLGVGCVYTVDGHGFGHGLMPKCGTAQPTIFWKAGAATEPP